MKRTALTTIIYIWFIAMLPFSVISVRADNTRALIINPKWIDVPSAYYQTVVNALEDLQIPYDIKDPDTLTLSTLKEYDIIFIPELGHTQPGWESFDANSLATMLEDYVESGGGLLYAPEYLKYSTSPVIFGFQDLRLRLDNVELEIVDNNHPISSSFSVGEKMYGNEADMYMYPSDAHTIGKVKDVESNADKGIGLATFQRGLGKVVATSFQIGWMSFSSAIYNGVPAEKWETLTKNAISWLLTPSTSTQDSIAPLWTQWYFWTNITLGIASCTFALTTIYYRRKALTLKEYRVRSNEFKSKEYKVCPNCGARLPKNAAFCGKCGKRLE